MGRTSHACLATVGGKEKQQNNLWMRKGEKAIKTATKREFVSYLNTYVTAVFVCVTSVAPLPLSWEPRTLL
jgi:hypothetical protein